MELTRRGLLPLGFAAAAIRPASGQEGMVALQGAAVFDGERRLGPATILIAGESIRAVGPGAAVPAGARRIDLTGRTVIPGLVSAHSHVGNSEGADTGGRFGTRENVLAQLGRYRRFGVTTVTALGLGAEGFFAAREAVRAGQAEGADLLGAGPGIGAPMGLPPAAAMNLLDAQVARPETPEAAREAVREMARQRVDIVKLWVDDNRGTVPMMPPALFGAAIDEAHRHGLKAAAHIHSLEQARAVVAAGVDVVAHGVRDQPVDAALVAAMRERGTWYIATIALDEANYFYAEHPERLDDPFLRAALNPALLARFADPAWRQQALAAAGPSRAAVEMNKRNLRTLHEAGVRIGFGTDSGATAMRVPGFAEHRELELMVEAGLTPEQALRCATAGAASLLGLQDRGLLREGRRADLVVLDGDPLGDVRQTRRIRAVWQKGREVAGPVA